MIKHTIHHLDSSEAGCKIINSHVASRPGKSSEESSKSFRRYVTAYRVCALYGDWAFNIPNPLCYEQGTRLTQDSSDSLMNFTFLQSARTVPVVFAKRPLSKQIKVIQCDTLYAITINVKIISICYRVVMIRSPWALYWAHTLTKFTYTSVKLTTIKPFLQTF